MADLPNVASPSSYPQSQFFILFIIHDELCPNAKIYFITQCDLSCLIPNQRQCNAKQKIKVKVNTGKKMKIGIRSRLCETLEHQPVSNFDSPVALKCALLDTELAVQHS